MIVTTADKPVASKQKKGPSSTSAFLLPETEGSRHFQGVPLHLHRAMRGRADRSRAAWKTKERQFSSLRTTHLLKHQRHAAEGRCESFSQERLSRSFYRWQSARRGCERVCPPVQLYKQLSSQFHEQQND